MIDRLPTFGEPFVLDRPRYNIGPFARLLTVTNMMLLAGNRPNINKRRK